MPDPVQQLQLVAAPAARRHPAERRLGQPGPAAGPRGLRAAEQRLRGGHVGAADDALPLLPQGAGQPRQGQRCKRKGESSKRRGLVFGPRFTSQSVALQSGPSGRIVGLG